MFDRRLWVLLLLMTAGAGVTVARLYQLQIVRGAEYRAKAEAVLVRPAAEMPAVRGRILDRAGLVLASDEPAVDVCVHYGVLAWSEKYLDELAKAIRKEPAWRGRPTSEAREEAARRIAAMWDNLIRVTGVTREELRRRCEQVVQRVESLRRYIERKRKEADPTASRPVELREQRMLHPIVRDISPEMRAALEMEMASQPFVRLEPAVRRRYQNDPAMRSVASLLGRLGQVSAEQIAAESEQAGGYRPGDRVGTSGVERLAERSLRGRRGSETRDLDGKLLEERPPVDGGDVRLTIDTELQQQIYEILSRVVAEHAPATGAACVVLSLPQRECLALVSYPSYDPATLATDFARLRDDTVHLPLRPRAIANAYPPGSIAKPATLLAALARGRVTPATEVECRGKLFPNVEGWHCWTHWNHFAPHGVVTCVTAIQHSCNIYFYTAGERLGAAGLTDAMRELLHGPAESEGGAVWRGTGLFEESRGLVPSEAALRRPLTPADARNFSIGQGELLMTPLQAATFTATIACGDFLEPTVLRPDSPRVPRRFTGLRPEHFRLVREGMYRCANLPGGTAFPHLRTAGMSVCGKTGSAESVPLVTRREYVFSGGDDSEQVVEAPTVEAAREKLDLPGDVKPLRSKPTAFWPPRRAEGKQTPPTHAWCVAFAPRDRPRVAISVLIEYGGGGGKVAAPAARQVIEALMNAPAGYLSREGSVADAQRVLPATDVPPEIEP